MVPLALSETFDPGPGRAWSWLRALPACVLLSGCALLGPASLSNGRMAYNDVANYTEDQQLLNAIVRERYGQTFGMLTVTSINANVKFRVGADSELQAWGTDGRTDELVPLALGVAYEENPTISYVPVQGEEVLRSLVTPITVDEGFLILAAANERHVAERYLYRRLGRLEMPIDRPLPAASGTAMTLARTLRESGVLRFGRAHDSPDASPSYVVVFSRYSLEEAAQIREFLGLVGVAAPPASGETIQVPFRLTTAAHLDDAITVESRSVLEWLRLAGTMIQLPPAHIESGVVEPCVTSTDPEDRFLTIRTSKSVPADAVVSIYFRGWHYYIDATDTRSKNSFRLVRFLVRLRLNARRDPNSTPVLTLPVH